MTAEAQIKVIAEELHAAADAILSATTLALQHVEEARKGDPAALEAIAPPLCAILEACAFQDIIGQRLGLLLTTLRGQADEPNPLLSGPGGGGEALDQMAADDLFGAGRAAP